MPAPGQGRPARGGRRGVRGAARRTLAAAAVVAGLAPALVALPAAGVTSQAAAAQGVAAQAPGTLSVPTTTTAEPEPVPAVVVADVTPVAVGPEDTLTVTALVTNTGAVPLETPRVALDVVRYRLTSREALRGWAAGEVATLAPTPVTQVALDEPLAPGESRSVTLRAPASDLRLLAYPESSGARGVVVRLSDPAVGVVGEGRGFLTWAPAGAVDPVRLSVVVPVTGPAPSPDDPAAWGARLAPEVAPGGRLDALVTGTATTPEVTWVVDPELVTAAASGIGGATAWSQQLVSAAAGRDVFMTDPFDPDLAALAGAGLDPIAAPSQPVDDVTPAPGSDDEPATPEDAATAAARAVAAWRSDLALPVPGTATRDVLAAARGTDHRLVVVEDAGLAGTGSTTAPATTTVDTSAGTVTALVPDALLGDLLASAAGLRPTTLPGPVADALRSHDRMLLLSELATVSQEPGSTRSQVLVTTDRGWVPDATALAVTLTALDASPLVDLVPLATLAGAPAAAVDRTPLSPTADPPLDVPAGALVRAWDDLDDLRAFATVAAEPARLTEGPERAVAAAVSTAWAGDTRARRSLLSSARQETAATLAGVSVVAGSDVNLISDHGNLPVRVRNDLATAVTVGVLLAPDDVRLSVEGVESAVLGPGEEATVQVPVRAIGSGDVDVTVQILGPTGDVVASGYSFGVRVRAEWETVGTAVIGGALALLVVGGIVRTARRGRSVRRTAPIRPVETP